MRISVLTTCKREHHAESPARRGLSTYLSRPAPSAAAQLLDRHDPDCGRSSDGVRPGWGGLAAGRCFGLSAKHRAASLHAAAGGLAARTAPSTG